jgi:hypothetical protein
MATIGPVNLEIVLCGWGRGGRLHVNYTIDWGALDKLGDIGYWEELVLCGADPSSDDRQMKLGNFAVYSNGEDTLIRRREFTVPRNMLIEDPLSGDDDELYVQVTLQDQEKQMIPVKRKSNTVIIGRSSSRTHPQALPALGDEPVARRWAIPNNSLRPQPSGPLGQ